MYTLSECLQWICPVTLHNTIKHEFLEEDGKNVMEELWGPLCKYRRVCGDRDRPKGQIPYSLAGLKAGKKCRLLPGNAVPVGNSV